MKSLLKQINKWLMMLIMWLTPSCEVITKKVSESLDHKLSPYDRLMIRLHTMECHLCARYRTQLLALHEAVQRLSDRFDELDDARLPEESKARIRKTLRRHSDPT